MMVVSRSAERKIKYHKCNAPARRQAAIVRLVIAKKETKSGKHSGRGGGEKRALEEDDSDSGCVSEEENRPHAQKKAMMSRTNMKLQVMKEQTQMLERKEAQRQVLASSAPTQSSAIQVPMTSILPIAVEVPRQVLRVQTQLENPTRFHLQEKQKRQVRQYLRVSARSASPTTTTTSAQSSANCDPSPTSPLSAAQSSTATSPSELDEFWDDFRALETGMESDVACGFLESFHLPNTVPETTTCNILDLFPTPQTAGNVSNSCPPELSEANDNSNSNSNSFLDQDIRAFVKDRQKKDNHNMIERRRRFNINDRIKELGMLLPKTNDLFFDLIRDQRQNKGTILKASVAYVKCLKDEVRKVPAMEEKQRQLEQHNRRLLLRIRELENQLQCHGLPVNEATWQPFSENDLSALIKLEPQPQSLNSGSSGVRMSNSSCSTPTARLAISIKREHSMSPSPSSGLSSAPSVSPAPPLSHYEDLMMEDDILPVNGDPMLSSQHLQDEPLSSDHMDFLV